MIDTIIDYLLAFIGLYGLMLALPFIVWMTQGARRIVLLLVVTALEGLWLYYQWGILSRADDWPLIRTAIIISLALIAGTSLIRLVRNPSKDAESPFVSLMMRNASDEPHPTGSANPNNL